MNKNQLQSAFEECRDFYYSWIKWEEFTPEQKAEFWESNKNRMECMSLNAERYIHVTDAIQEASNIESVKRDLIHNWDVIFAEPSPPDTLTFAQLQAFRAYSQELVKNRLNYLPCNWIYSGITRCENDNLNDITTTKGPVSIQWDLHLVIEGTGLYQGKNYQLTAPPGTVVLIPPSENLAYSRAATSSVWVHQWVAFPMADSPTELIQQLPKTGGLHHCHLVGDTCETVYNLLNEIASKNHADSDIVMAERRQTLEQIVTLLFSAAQESFQANQKVMQACQYINNNLSSNLTIEDIARQCSLSPSRLSHIFREKFGVSPIVWRNEVRLAKACQLLSDSQNNVGEIAALVGYEDQLYFSKLFKKRMGFTPSGYREIQRQGS